MFRVWAPVARRVSVWVDGDEHEMTAAGGGWWESTVDNAGAGSRYAFIVDGGDRLPDPRSSHQPDGVHRESAVYHHDFGWTDQDWTGRALPGSVIYELHIGAFTPAGTLDAAIERLDHLVELGVDLVELMPVNAFNGDRGWGYDGVLWYAVHQPYGGPDALKRFVNACHRRGLGVVLDVVHNHLGPSGGYLDRFGPYFAGSNIWGPSLNLDGPNSDEVRRYVVDNVLGWFRDFHLDGLRLDAVHALRDNRAIHLLEEIASEVDALSAHVRRPLTLIAESDLNDPKLITARAGGGAGGYGLTAQWDDDVHHALHTALTGERHGYYADFGSLETLASTLRNAFFHAETYSSFRGRTHGRRIDGATTPGYRFVVFTSDHDQIGNRAVGDRPSETLSPGLLAVSAAIVLTSPYTPMLFMGEEWGARTRFPFFSGHPEPELAERIRAGRLAEFAEHGWTMTDVPDPMAESTFDAAKLDWSEPDQAEHADLLRTYQELIALRRQRPELSDPRLDRLRVDYDESQRWLIIHRGDLRVIANLADAERKIPLDAPMSHLLLGSASTRIVPGESAVNLGAESFAIAQLALTTRPTPA